MGYLEQNPFRQFILCLIHIRILFLESEDRVIFDFYSQEESEQLKSSFYCHKISITVLLKIDEITHCVAECPETIKISIELRCLKISLTQLEPCIKMYV